MLGDFDLVVGKRKLALEMGLVHSPAGVHRPPLHQNDFCRGQAHMNEPAMEIVLQRLVDEAGIRRQAQHGGRLDIAAPKGCRIAAACRIR